MGNISRYAEDIGILTAEMMHEGFPFQDHIDDDRRVVAANKSSQNLQFQRFNDHNVLEADGLRQRPWAHEDFAQLSPQPEQSRFHGLVRQAREFGQLLDRCAFEIFAFD